MGLRVAARRWVQGEVQEPVLCLSHLLFAGPAWLAVLGLRPGSVREKGGGIGGPRWGRFPWPEDVAQPLCVGRRFWGR